MSWQFVFNSNLYATAGISINDLLEFVKKTGYKFFTFNGMVYDLNMKSTDIPTEELF